MSFKTLLQETYKDDNGNKISAVKVDFLAPYMHRVDGFYNWECGNCKKHYASRSCGWDISGQVLKCSGCGFNNLLVRTNTDDISKLCSNNNELTYREEQVSLKEKNLKEYYIHKSIWENVVKLLREIKEENEKKKFINRIEYLLDYIDNS